MKEVQDRVVQFSNRYKLTNVETGEVLGTFDFEEETGTVQQVGTEIDAELFDSIANDLAKRVRVDAKQNFSAGQKQQARANIDAAGTNGTYPTLGAGYLANSKYVIVEPTSVGWWKIADLTIDQLMQIHNVNSSSYSGVILIQGVTRSGDGFDYANTGLIEIDATAASGVFATTNMRNIIKVISGDIEPNNLAVVNNGDTLSIYANYPVYARYCWTVICEAYGQHTGKAIEITPTFYGTTAPSGAVYAVVRNNASTAESDRDGNNIADTYAKQGGSYPELGAGYLANGTTISSGSSGAGWHKFMQVSNLYTSNGYSAILLVNGVLHTNDDTHSNSEHSGIIEIDYYNTYNTGATYYAVNVLAGNLTPEDFCLTVSGNSISIYKKLKQYQIVQFVQFSVVENGADTVYMDELQPSAPEGAVYAVVRNIASYAESIPVASESVFGGAKMWVDGGKLYIKTE